MLAVKVDIEGSFGCGCVDGVEVFAWLVSHGR
jgi:hypothetical protein